MSRIVEAARRHLPVVLVSLLFLFNTAVAPLAVAQSTASVTATCKDGTTFTGQSKRGACSHHGGVQTWTSGGGSQASTAATPPPPSAAASAPAMPAAPTGKSTAQATRPSSGQVWLNTASNVYHCPGTRYYGKTKAGEYMTEAAAKARGARPSLGKVCNP
jgi:hypothetical protein